MKIKPVKTRVKHLLEQVPHLRDSDERLIATIWYYEAGLKEQNMRAIDFLNLYIEKVLTNSESIRRSRQQLQEKHPHLRGKVYKVRHEEQQRETKQELGYKN